MGYREKTGLQTPPWKAKRNIWNNAFEDPSPQFLINEN